MSFFQISSKPAMREQAGAKLHLLHNATEQTIERIDTADEKTHDSTLFKTGPWLENRLMLFDPPTSSTAGLR